ncbi:MAG: molybdopterin-dependent oxidoreductase [Candidatus Binatia bacterium]
MDLLRIDGAVRLPRSFAFADLASLPEQVQDVGTFLPGREGGGVRLRSILAAVEPTAEATHLTLVSSDDTFSASVPLAAVQDAIVAYCLGNDPLPTQKGDPVRFFIPQVEECALGGVDACANVKFVGLIRLSHGPGSDTRPTSKREHEEHHQQDIAKA